VLKAHIYVVLVCALLEEGEHKFAFALVIPSSTAPFERCSHGRVYHRVYGVCKFGGPAGSSAEGETGVDLIVNPAGYCFCY
jgi:hypothetical protein